MVWRAAPTAALPTVHLPVHGLLMAALFGAGQHAVTRYVDGRAEEILTAGAPAKSHPKKDHG